MENNTFKPNSSVVWEKQPASDWADAYPLGNGRIGAMVFGSPVDDVISLNHDLLWRRFVKQPTTYTYKTVDEIKRLCREKKYVEAEKILKATVPNQKAIYINPFVYGFDQYIHLSIDENSITNYKRYLNFETATVSSEFESDGVLYKKESFCSATEGVLITHITASLPFSLTGFVSISRYCDPECEVTGWADYDTVYASGRFEEGVEFAAASKIIPRNGRLTGGKKEYGCNKDVSLKKEFGYGFTFSRNEQFNPERGASVYFDGCDEILIVTSLSVDAEDDNPLEYVKKSLIREFSFKDSYESHCRKFASYYRRTELEISEKFDFNHTTSELLQKMREEKSMSPALAELTYNMSKFTAITAGMTKPHGEIKAPMNLQGIWARDIRPPWECDYHLDLNMQMCYWPLPAMGLPDLMEPFLQWAERILPQARYTAKDLYGCEGAAYIGCCDYKTIGCGDIIFYGALGIPAWIIQILWIYYEHSTSKALLKRIYKIMKEVSLFYSGMLEKTDGGELSFPFGASPEMGICEDGHVQWLSSPSTFDLTMVREFYENLKKTARILGDKKTIRKSEDILTHLKEPHVTENGSLCEWLEEHIENDPGHRHRSPFAAFCPGSLYTQYTDPEMVKAMEKLLYRRLAAGNATSASFSYTLDAQILARLSKGDEAYEMLSSLLFIHSLDNMFVILNDWDLKNGTPTWFPGIKVMQIEALIGFASSVCEMFYQDNKGIIRILPALPTALPNGSLKGITGRFGVKSDIEWKGGKLTRFKFTCTKKRLIKIILPDYIDHPTIEKNGKEAKYKKEDKLILINAEKGAVYSLKP